MGDHYYGFDSKLDLAYRGGLSDTLMMYVRSPAWSYWRSHAYDFYDGRTWAQSDTSVQTIERSGALFDLNFSNRFWLRDDYFVQTYSIVQEMPNLIFTAGQPLHVYLAADEIGLDTTGGIRVGETLKPGMVYSVMSLRQDYHAGSTAGEWTAGGYPAETSSRPIRNCRRRSRSARAIWRRRSRRVRRPHTTKSSRVRDYLLNTYTYDYFPPPQPPNSDAVDQFLFEDKRGVCEHFVSAMVVMLRSLGIPARLVGRVWQRDIQRIHQLLRGARQRRPCLGRSLFPALWLGSVRSNAGLEWRSANRDDPALDFLRRTGRPESATAPAERDRGGDWRQSQADTG